MNIHERLVRVENTIRGENGETVPELFSVYSNTSFERLSGALAKGQTYGEIPEQISSQLRIIRDKYGPRGSREFARLLLARTIRAWTETEFPFDSNGIIRTIYDREIDRLLTIIETNDGAYEFDFSNDSYVKDLQCFTGRMVACGAQVADLQSGMPRRLILSDGLANLPTNLIFALRAGGFSPYCEIHTHTPTLNDFNPDGWDRCYLCIAEICRGNRSIKGMIGSSWFYDPDLETISPNLAYLRRRPLENGAKLFRIGPLPASKRDALATSKTRRKYYEEGKYTPTHYALVWSRDELLRWADSTN